MHGKPYRCITRQFNPANHSVSPKGRRSVVVIRTMEFLLSLTGELSGVEQNRSEPLNRHTPIHSSTRFLVLVDAAKSA